MAEDKYIWEKERDSERMLVFNIQTSVGEYECKVWAEPGTANEDHYHCELQRLHCAPGRAYEIYSGSFGLFHKDGRFYTKRYRKAPTQPEYWKEIKTHFGRHIAVNI